jgi:hypothetical protein
MSSAQRSLSLTVAAGIGIFAVALVVSLFVVVNVPIVLQIFRASSTSLLCYITGSMLTLETRTRMPLINFTHLFICQTVLSLKPGDGSKKDSKKIETNKQESSSNSRSIDTVAKPAAEKVVENGDKAKEKSMMNLQKEEAKDAMIESMVPTSTETTEKDNPPAETPVPAPKPTDEKPHEAKTVQIQASQLMSSPRAVEDSPVAEESVKVRDVEPVDSSPNEEAENGNRYEIVQPATTEEAPVAIENQAEIPAEEITTDQIYAAVPAETNSKEFAKSPTASDTNEKKPNEGKTSDGNWVTVDAKTKDEEGQSKPTDAADLPTQENTVAAGPNNGPKKKPQNRRPNKKKKGKKRK